MHPAGVLANGQEQLGGVLGAGAEQHTVRGAAAATRGCEGVVELGDVFVQVADLAAEAAQGKFGGLGRLVQAGKVGTEPSGLGGPCGQRPGV